MNTMCFLRRGLFVLVSIFSLGWLSATNVHAQPSGARHTDFIYRVIAHDTLIDLAQKYTNTPQNWPLLQTLNNVDDTLQLSIGKYLRIPFELIPEQPSQARVSYLTGQATVNGKPLAVGDMLSEGDLLATAARGYITLTLEDNSISTVTASSTVRIQRLRTFKGTGLLDAIFTMEQGSVESAVAPENTGVGRFEIRTPISITGVRGTRLRVHAGNQGVQTEVVQGAAQVGSGGFSDPSVLQGQGAALATDGRFLGIRPLLPAPQLEAIQRGPQGWQIPFAPVGQAQSYVVQVTQDADGTQLLSRQAFSAPPATFSTQGPGTYYVIVRAVDSDGVMGQDSRLSFQGQSALQSGTGLPISTGFGDIVLLTVH
ncbi:MAG: FecR domain-containing protein [Burkholderiaceae bacterium]|nr:FecR domain-containing protein [Burkholderiaceae bacterium]